MSNNTVLWPNFVQQFFAARPCGTMWDAPAHLGNSSFSIASAVLSAPQLRFGSAGGLSAVCPWLHLQPRGMPVTKTKNNKLQFKKNKKTARNETRPKKTWASYNFRGWSLLHCCLTVPFPMWWSSASFSAASFIYVQASTVSFPNSLSGCDQPAKSKTWQTHLEVNEATSHLTLLSLEHGGLPTPDPTLLFAAGSHINMHLYQHPSSPSSPSSISSESARTATSAATSTALATSALLSSSSMSGGSFDPLECWRCRYRGPHACDIQAECQGYWRNQR